MRLRVGGGGGRVMPETSGLEVSMVEECEEYQRVEVSPLVQYTRGTSLGLRLANVGKCPWLCAKSFPC